MKALHSILLVVSCVIIIFSCQRDPAEPPNSFAQGSLVKTSSGNCSPVSLSGIFLKNSLLTIDNFMDVQVNFVSVGSYNIKSDTINGYSFRSVGQVSVPGPSIIRLQASGTPVNAGTDVFNINYGTSNCQVNIPVSVVSAAFTYGGSPGTCSGMVLSGTFSVGTPLNGTNTAALQVNVTAIGAYSISSDNVNGIIFSGGGAFTSTGLQTIVLMGNGSPLAAGPFTYHLGTAAGCNLVVVATPALGNLATVITTVASGILCTSATSGGNITNDGGTAISARGICVATTHIPVLGQGTTVNGTGLGSFTSTAGGLIINTIYYVRAYATNTAGTAYGNELSFTTAASCPPVTVYVVGYDGISGVGPRPKVWKRTGGSFVETDLPVSTASGNTIAHSVFATSTDVYVAGENGQSAEIWKNNLNGPLGSGLNSVANSVYVSGVDVYAAGEKYGGMAVFWKNGNMTTLGVVPPLGSGTQSSYAKSIFVSGNDIYVAGQQQNTSAQYLATVWKNGVPLYLSDGTASAEATSVFVSGGDVYVCGTDNNQAKLWKNGVGLTLSASTSANSAQCVFVSGTDVYVAGVQHIGTTPNSYAVLWKNGAYTLLTSAGDGNYAQSVFVKDNNVYVVGTKDSFWANTVATIWINGFATPLTSGGADANALSVFVQ